MTVNRRRFLQTTAAVGLGAGAGVLGAPAIAQARTKVKVGYLHTLAVDGQIWLGMDRGSFAKHGVEPELVQFTTGLELFQAMIGGSIDMLATGAVISNFPARGQGKMFLVNDVEFATAQLWVREDQGIKSFADLKGKKLGHVPGIQWRTISRYMVRAAGLDPDKDVTLLDLAVGMQVPAVVGGSVDATLSLEPVGSVAVASGQAKRAMTNPVAQVIADPFYSGVSLLTVKFLKERAQVARKVVEVIDEATKLANADFDKYKPIIPKYTPMRAEQLDLLAKPYLRAFGDLNDTDLNSYQALVDVFQKEGVLQSPIAVRDKILKTTDFGS
jgi:NitT/TauT family transport system substrate-binding protein